MGEVIQFPGIPDKDPEQELKELLESAVDGQPDEETSARIAELLLRKQELDDATRRHPASGQEPGHDPRPDDTLA